ncbi:hypothetical protein [Pseudanabaena mucicola]|uniref:hypothetical protein n=1 Tax=Pseudanabaena mucicola TaxID=71190 RepID=UPI0025787B8C|nr:hypothetical protein [Pseudanabaena mucicola]
MTSIFSKLTLKDQTEILVLNAPESFEPELAALTGIKVLRDAREAREIVFTLVFVTTLPEIEAAGKTIAKKAKGDALIWFAYPKGTSKKYKCNFNRDNGWEALGSVGFERVRQVAIDEDWTAMRFRRVEFVKTMKRRESFALTKQGKAKTKK